MSTLIQLRPRNGDWLKSLQGLSPEIEAFFSQAQVEALQFFPDSSTLVASLLIKSLPEDASAFVALKKALSKENIRARLKLRYEEGMLTAPEYLALHFQDLAEIFSFVGNGETQGVEAVSVTSITIDVHSRHEL